MMRRWMRVGAMAYMGFMILGYGVAHASPVGSAPDTASLRGSVVSSSVGDDVPTRTRFSRIQGSDPVDLMRDMVHDSPVFPDIVECLRQESSGTGPRAHVGVGVSRCMQILDGVPKGKIHDLAPQYLSALSQVTPLMYALVDHEVDGTDTFYYVTQDGHVFRDHEMSVSVMQDIIHQLYHNNIPMQSRALEEGITAHRVMGWLQVAFWIAFMAVMGILVLVQGKQVFKFFQNPAKRLLPQDIVPFDEIAGNAYIKAEMMEISAALKDPKSPAFQAIPSGMLFAGPPGCGKTMIAAALAKESGLPFYHASGSDFVEMFVGLGPRRMGLMFDRIRRRHKQAILFIDEIDAIAQKRSSTGGGDSVVQEYENTLNKMLQMMDGADNKSRRRRRRGSLLVLAATNRADILDPALLRPNRLERTVHFHLPPYHVREELASIQARRYAFDTSLTPALLAQWTNGLSGADMDGIIRQAYLHAMRAQRSSITAGDVTHALDLKLMGEPSEVVLSPQERCMTAWHEAAHALTMLVLNGAATVRRISIVPRGASLGSVATVPREDQHTQTLYDLFGLLITCLAGRAGEQALYHDDVARITTGATQDIEQATAIARGIVEQFGFAQDIGMVRHSYHPMDPQRNRPMSEYASAQLDRLIHRLIRAGYASAQAIIQDHASAYAAIVEDLLRDETITGVAAMAHLDGDSLDVQAYYAPLLQVLQGNTMVTEA